LLIANSYQMTGWLRVIMNIALANLQCDPIWSSFYWCTYFKI